MRRIFHRFGPAAAVSLLLSAVVAVALTWGAWHDPSHTYVGVGADPQQSMWFMRWFPFALTHGQNPWQTDYLNYPTGINVTWNTCQPLLALLMWPVTTLFGVVTAYNVEVALGMTLSSWFAFFAIRRFSSERSAIIGGLLYGFSPYVLGQLYGHPHLVFVVTPPLFLLCLHSVARGSVSVRRGGAYAGALVVAQFYISEEILVLEMIGAACWGVAAFCLDRNLRDGITNCLRALSVSAVIGVVLCAWPLSVQLFGANRVPQAIQGPDIFVSDAGGFFFPTAAQLLHPMAMAYTGNISEWSAYLGIPLTLVLAWYGWKSRGQLRARILYAAGAAIALLSMGPHLHLFGHKSPLPLPWWIAGHVPFLEKILPGRFMVLVFLAAGVALAMALDLVIDMGRRVAGAVAVGAVFLTLAPVALPTTSVGTAANLNSSELPNGSPTLVLPYPGTSSIDAMFLQAQADFPFRMAGGYFIGSDQATAPLPEWSREAMAIQDGAPEPTFDLSKLRSELAKVGIGAVIVAPGPSHAREAQLVRSTLGPPSLVSGDLSIWQISNP